MSDTQSKLFDKAGYIPLKDYLDDINVFTKRKQWRLPLGHGDRVHIFFLKIVASFSWFSSRLYIKHESITSPAYSILASYLRVNKFVDSFAEMDVSFPGYYSFYLEKSVSIRGNKEVISGQGVSDNKPEAFSIAMGEILERTVTGLFDTNKKLLFASPDELSGKYLILYPPKYHRFLDYQKKRYRELNVDSKEKIYWVKGECLITNETTYIPRQITSWFNENRNAMKSVLVHSTTNGSAGYFTKSGAILRGLLEVVQRDAFLVHWLTMIPPEVIEEESLPEHIQKRMRDYKRLGLTLYILNTTSIPIPSVLVVAINSEAEIPQITIGGASALTFEDAICSALKEIVMMTEIFSRTDHLDISVDEDGGGQRMLDIGKLERQLYWRGEERIKEFMWFISGKRVSYVHVCKQNLMSGSDDSQKLEQCLSALRSLGEDYYPAVYYPKNKIQKKLGFYIAQVYIPKAFPFYLFEGYGTFDSERLKEFALSKKVTKWGLNHLPHMFS